jgi:Protein of unknown function (DUF3164)
MSTLNIKDLTPAQKKSMLKELQKEQEQEAKLQKQTRKDYKDKVDKVVPKLFDKLWALSENISKVKTTVYNTLDGLVTQKGLAYNRQDQDQQTHSFSSLDGSKTITIGFRVNDGWDDTVNIGIAKVSEFIQTLATDKNSKALVETILQLLSKDAKGSLKASRVLQLKKLSESINNKDFADAIGIIESAYKPVPTKQFVSLRYKDEVGNTVELPLSITDAPLLESELKSIVVDK